MGLRSIELLRSFVLLVALLLLSACTGVEQPDPGVPTVMPNTNANIVAVQEGPEQERIQLVGVVESIAGTSVAVNGLTVDIGSASTDGVVEAGATVQIRGEFGGGPPATGAGSSGSPANGSSGTGGGSGASTSGNAQPPPPPPPPPPPAGGGGDSSSGSGSGSSS